MKLRKWNYKGQVYEEHEVPEKWKIIVYTDNMNEIINCASCGSLLRYGDCYTSLELHNGHGFGYPVCEKCYRKEWERRKNNS